MKPEANAGLQRRGREAKPRKRDRAPRTAAANKDPLRQAKEQSEAVWARFHDGIRESDITAQQDAEAQLKMLRLQNERFASDLAALCRAPLQNGYSAKRVAAAVGLSLDALTFSRTFRDYVGGARAEHTDAAYGRGPDGQARPEADGRAPFTEYSAALAHVGIVQNAYDQMRKPGADPELVKQNSDRALSALYAYADEDGLDRGEVQRNMRHIVGQITERDPRQAAVFAEPAPEQSTEGEPQTAWTGGYGNTSNGEAPTPREPVSADEHRAAVARTMHGELANTNSPAEFNDVLEQYAIGAKMRENPGAVEVPEDPAAQARINRSQAMFASMGDDLRPQDQKLAYMDGFRDAFEAVEETHPEVVAKWSEAEGPKWAARMEGDFGDQASGEREQRQGTGPRSEPGPGSSGTEQDGGIQFVDADTVGAQVVDRPSGARQRSPGEEPGMARVRQLAASSETLEGRRGTLVLREKARKENGLHANDFHNKSNVVGELPRSSPLEGSSQDHELGG